LTNICLPVLVVFGHAQLSGASSDVVSVRDTAAKGGRADINELPEDEGFTKLFATRLQNVARSSFSSARCAIAVLCVVGV
jgi:hypothetical protein